MELNEVGGACGRREDALVQAVDLAGLRVHEAEEAGEEDVEEEAPGVLVEACVGEEYDGDARVAAEEEDGGCGLDRAGEKLGLLSAMATAMVWRGLTWRREGKERGGT